MVWRNLPPYHRFQYFTLYFLTRRLWQSVNKHLQRWYRCRLPQTMVDSWYCLDRVVPEGMSQVSRGSEVGNHKRRSLNTLLSSGTSAGTFACHAGPYRKCWGEAGAKNEPNRYFVPDRKNGLKIDPHVSNLDFIDFVFEGFRSTLRVGIGYFSNERGFSEESSLQRISSKKICGNEMIRR